MSAREIAPMELDIVCAELQRSGSYRRACKLAGVNVKALRWHRYGDPAIGRRTAAARSCGLLRRAAVLEQRARELLGRAMKLTREAERITRP